MYNANNVAGNTFYGYKNDNHNVFAEQTDAPDINTRTKIRTRSM